jgi:hypothetical protein
MPNSLTLHFHLKHFKESGLPFSEYAMLLLYEQREDWRFPELEEIFHLSNRTLARMRDRLTSEGFLIKINGGGDYSLSNKLYK